MSQPETSSQDSTGTQEIYSQGSFQEIWESLNRTFSNPEKMIQGVLTDEIPLTIEFKDQPLQDNYQVTCEQRTLKCSGHPISPDSQLLSDLLQSPSRLDSQTLNIRNGHPGIMLNGTSPAKNMRYERIQLSPILPNTNYPGQFDFSIGFEQNNDPITKATPWVHVADHQKLFVKMQCVCPILFYVNGNPPPGSGVRAILMYKRPEHYKDIVIRCPNHKNTSKDDHPNQDHVMRCENPSTIYESCPKTNRLSLFVPLSAVNPVAGEGYFKELFKFTCFNSCVGGMNRRPTFILFRLECGTKLYGRAVVEVRICASPGRDSTEKETSTNQKNAKNTEKRNANEPTSTTDLVIPMPQTSTHSPESSSPTSAYPPRASVLMSARKDSSSAPEPFQFHTSEQKKRQYPAGAEGYVYKKVKRGRGDSSDDDIFTISIRGRERYELLQKINEGLHALDNLKPPDQNSYCYANTGVSSSQEFTKIQPKVPGFEIKKEKPDSSQCHVTDVSPESSQEETLQLSRTSSNASSQSSQHSCSEFTATRVTMKRTISLKKSPVPKAVLHKENMNQ